MTKHIYVGCDGSEPSAEAVAWAAEEAVARGAQLHIVSCYSLPYISAGAMGWGAPEMMDALTHVATDHAASAKAEVAASHPGLKVTTEVVLGAASSTLMHGRVVDDLIVVGASGRHGAGAFWLGSTPRRLIRHSPCPVAVVRGPASRGKPDRVIVGIDGSTASDAALDWAGDHADLYQVELVIVHAWAYPYIEVKEKSSMTRDLMEVDAACVLDRALEHARERLGCDVSGRLVENGAVPALLEAARDGDVIVLGSRGHGALAAGVLGSTVNAVLDRAVVPVVVVRGAEDND